MENVKDKLLGELYYEHAWIKTDMLEYNGINLMIIFQAFSNETVSDEQKALYIRVVGNFAKIIEKAHSALMSRLGDNICDIIINGIYFNRFNEFGLLCENEGWEEHGLAVKYDENMNVNEIGSQDIMF